MKEVQVVIPKDIVDIVNSIDDNTDGYDVYLGGGYLRDSYTDNIPKDLDIVLIPNRMFPAKPGFIPEGYKSDVVINGEYTKELKARGVVALHKMSGEGLTDIDLIIYQKRLSLQQLSVDFDMPINQILWKANSPVGEGNKCTCTTSDEFVEDHENKVIRFVHKYGYDRMVKRMNKFRNKFPTYVADDSYFINYNGPVNIPHAEYL